MDPVFLGFLIMIMIFFIFLFVGRRAIPELKAALVDHVESLSSRPSHWPSFQPLV